MIACYLQAGNARVWRPGSRCPALFGTCSDGTLGFLRKYDVEVAVRQLFWIGMVGCAAACRGQKEAPIACCVFVGAGAMARSSNDASSALGKGSE
jgi:hypothetical protein